MAQVPLIRQNQAGNAHIDGASPSYLPTSLKRPNQNMPHRRRISFHPEAKICPKNRACFETDSKPHRWQTELCLVLIIKPFPDLRQSLKPGCPSPWAPRCALISGPCLDPPLCLPPLCAPSWHHPYITYIHLPKLVFWGDFSSIGSLTQAT